MGLPLITKAEYKTYAGIASTTHDTAIDTLIPKVSALVKSICRRTFVDSVNDPKQEYHEGGSDLIVPDEYPLGDVIALEYSKDYGNTYVSLTEYVDYVVSKASNSIKAISSRGFPAMVNGYRLNYTAGYNILPEDLKLAVLDLTVYYIKNDSAIHSNKAPGTNTVQIEYVTTTNLPAHIKRVLDLYAANYN